MNKVALCLALGTASLFIQTTSFAEEAGSTSARSAVHEAAEQPPVAPSPEEPESRLTKNWGGARSALSAKGIDLALIYKWEHSRLLAGGLEPGATTLGNIDFRTSFDLDKLAGWKGGSVFLYALANHGGDPSTLVGDFQVTSNIESPANTLKLYEAWFQQVFWNERLSVLAGLHDLNSEFYVTDSSTLFLNSSFGVGKELAQTGVNGPSIFPTTAPSLRLKAEPDSSFSLQAALFNAVAGNPDTPQGTHIRLKSEDGFLAIAEAAYLRGTEKGSTDASAKYAIGAWTYTKATPSLSDESVLVRNRGAYLLADRALGESVSAFFRYGVALGEANEVGSCLSTGVVFNGLIPGRDRDRFGIALTRAATSDALAPSSAESTLEAIYRIELIPGVALQPDFQYVIHPSANPDIPDATLAGVRAELSF